MFLNSNIFFSNSNSNCSNSLDMRNVQEQVKKAFCYQKLFWPLAFHCFNKLFYWSFFSIARTNFSHSRSEQFCDWFQWGWKKKKNSTKIRLFLDLSSFKIVVIFNNTSIEIKTKSADELLKMTTILKELRIPPLRYKNKTKVWKDFF